MAPVEKQVPKGNLPECIYWVPYRSLKTRFD